MDSYNNKLSSEQKARLEWLKQNFLYTIRIIENILSCGYHDNNLDLERELMYITEVLLMMHDKQDINLNIVFEFLKEKGNGQF